MKKWIAFLCFAGLLAVIAVYADEPSNTINASRHPNLAKAQLLINQAYQSIVDAQKANEFDLRGHAAKAKTLIEETNKELKLAAVEANQNPGRKEGVRNEERALENKPTENINESKHPNLAKAQRLIDDAYARIVDAQKANDFDLGGHAAKAKTLLEQTSKELKLAAVEANK